MRKLKCSQLARTIFEAIEEEGGRVYLVGGVVRDYMMKRTNKDYDIEVFHMSYAHLVEILSRFGQVMTFGSSFAIIHLDTLPGYEFALPRVEHKTGTKHQDFRVEIDPELPLEKAASRRDFTINALMYEYKTGVIYDFFDGIGDLSKKQLRIVNAEKFKEDPLRLLRAASFIARYDLKCTPETFEECRKMVEEGMLEDVSRERIYEEYNKILMAPHPSAGFIFLRDIHALPSYLEALVHTHQRPDYHPEGNVFNHTMLVLDLAALTKKDVSDPLAFMWSALLHDIGKPAVTTPDGHALRHDIVGAEVFDREVKIIQGKKMRIYVRTMIAYHMRLMNMARHHIRPITYKRLLKEIEGKVPVRDLMMLSRCDKLGRGAITYDTIIAFDQKMEDIMAKCGTEAPEPLVTGQDLIDANFEEKSQYRQLLEKAYDMQLAGYSKEKILRGLKNGK